MMSCDLINLVTKCKVERSFVQALNIEGRIHQGDIDASPSLGNLLVSMWVEIGSMGHAQMVFDKLVYKDNKTWNSIIKGYADHGDINNALTMYQRLCDDDLGQLEAQTVMALVKACAYQRDLDRGHMLYLDISSKVMFEKNIAISRTFVDMYAKCGSLSRAQNLFDKLQSRDVVVWTALIQGYTDQGLAEKALTCLKQMQGEGVSPDAAALVCALKACGIIRAVAEGLETHVIILKRGLSENNNILGGALVDMYARFGMLIDAHKVFDMLFVHDVVTWTCLLAGYAEHGQSGRALSCLEAMQQESVLPSAVTYVCGLKACGNFGISSYGLKLHSMIFGAGFESNIYVGSALVDMYVKHASLTKARDAFDGLAVRTVVSWNALLSGLIEHGLDEAALGCFQKMLDECISPDSVTLVCILKGCSHTRDLTTGLEVYADVVKKGYETGTITANTAIDMFAKCGSLDDAWIVFSKLLTRNIVSWTLLIGGYIDFDKTEDAFKCLEIMRQDDIYPNAATFVCCLKACTNLREAEKGQKLHSDVIEIGLEEEILVGNTIIDMYAKCCLFQEAFEVLEKLSNRDVVSWNALISAFVEHGKTQESLDCMKQMEAEAIPPDAVTYICSLRVCCNTGDTDKGKELHAEMTKRGLSEAEDSMCSTLVAMYSKFGLLLEAKHLLDELPVKPIVAWNAILSAYIEQSENQAAIMCFESMKTHRACPDLITVVCTLKACGCIGASGQGQELHSFIFYKGLEAEPAIGNTLVFMYAKCGLLATAQNVFDKLSDRNVVSWTALLAGYAQVGENRNVFQVFEGMIAEGIIPDPMTFGSILSVCSYSGLVNEGQMYFAGMHNDVNSFPTPWHHLCMIDLLGRAGQLEKAIILTKEIPCHPGNLAWRMLLGACRKWGLVDLGNLVFGHAFELDEEDAPAFVCISNIYCDATMVEDVTQIKRDIDDEQFSL